MMKLEQFENYIIDKINVINRKEKTEKNLNTPEMAERNFLNEVLTEIHEFKINKSAK